MMFTERNCHPVVPEAKFRRFLRFPPTRALGGELEENARWAREWFAGHARPWICGREVRVEVVAGAGVIINGRSLGGVSGAERLNGATSVVVVAASAGGESEAEAVARWQAGEPDRAFFLESYAAAVVDELLSVAARNIFAAGAGRISMPRCGPGYRGWPISDMPFLLGILAEAAPFPGPLAVLTSGMLVPKKSQLVIFGLDGKQHAGSG